MLTLQRRLLGAALITLDVDLGANGCLAHLREEVLHGPGLLLPDTLRRAGLHLQNGERLERLARLAEERAGSGSSRSYHPVGWSRPPRVARP